jgi:hypothetical protein
MLIIIIILIILIHILSFEMGASFIRSKYKLYKPVPKKKKS